MPVIRSLISGSKLVVTSFAEFKNNLFKSTQYHDFFISLVPTQLQFILSKNPLFLTQFKLI